MSIPQGDLPDWQTLTSPVFQNATANVSPLNSPFTLISSPNPYRIWQLMLGINVYSGNIVDSGGDHGVVEVKDGTGALILGTGVDMVALNTQYVVPMTLPFYGLQPRASGGLYKVTVTVSMSGVNTAVFALCSAIFSQP